MNSIIVAGIVTDAAMAANNDKPCGRSTLTLPPLQAGQPDTVVRLVAWGQFVAEQLVAAVDAVIVQGRLTLPRGGDQQPTPTIEVSRLHAASPVELNSICLVGRAGRDPEMRFLSSGKSVANLTLAVNRRSRDEEPDWFNLEIWGKQAQVATDYVRKGSLLGIIGSFRLDTWTHRQTGEQRFKPVVRVDRLELLGSKRDGDGGSAPEAPARTAAPARRSRPAPVAPVWDGGAGADNDIPF